MKNNIFNYVLYEIDKYGNKKFLHAFYTLNELKYYMDINHFGISDLVSDCSYYPLYKYRVYSNRLKQFL